MLPKNHLVTEFVRKDLIIRVPPPGWDEYRTKLTDTQRDELDKVILFHRNALNPLATVQPPQPAAQFSPATALPMEQRDSHVHIHHHYHRSNYWYDWFIFQSLMPSTPSYHRPAAATRRTKDEENNTAAIILATIVVGCAVVASLYTLIEAGRCFEQLAYAEDVFGNMTRLAMTAFGGALGVGGGLLFGSAVLGMPILGAICGALIFAGLAIAASKKIIEELHRKTNDDSALAYDPRFCLSRKEEATLEDAGYDVFAVGEALRALAIQYDSAHNQASTLKFWSSDNRDKAEIIDMVRDLKQGWHWDDKSIKVGSQHFNLNLNAVMGEVIGLQSDNALPPPCNPHYQPLSCAA